MAGIILGAIHHVYITVYYGAYEYLVNPLALVIRISPGLHYVSMCRVALANFLDPTAVTCYISSGSPTFGNTAMAHLKEAIGKFHRQQTNMLLPGVMRLKSRKLTLRRLILFQCPIKIT